MRSNAIFRFVGSFLLVFSFILAVPLLVSVYYGESFMLKAGFITASVSALVLGYALKLSSSDGFDPTTEEAMFATVLGWVLAVGFGAIPFLGYTGVFNAYFEAAAGLTTTGISMFLEPGKLPKSILFWRSLSQWVGGLGILTFFIAVIRESGGVSRRLFSAETHKTDSGSIRPSLSKSIIALWKVYGFLTVIIAATYIALGVTVFDSVLHAFSAISTGGFSTMGASIAGFDSAAVEAATVLFMFIGGVNFVLLYRFLRGETSSLFKSSEFRLYSKIFLLVGGLISLELIMSGGILSSSVLDAFFQSAALVSSTGYSTTSILGFSVALQLLLIAVMFVGGSVGSTAGGLKVFRLKTMIELVKTRIRAYSLPETAVNEVKFDGEILSDDTVRTVSVLFFSWLAIVFLSTLAVVAVEDVGIMAALSGSVSAAGNMGPVYMEGTEMVALSPLVKTIWIAVMIAGRLEMLPVLAIFNSDLFKDSK